MLGIAMHGGVVHAESALPGDALTAVGIQRAVEEAGNRNKPATHGDVVSNPTHGGQVPVESAPHGDAPKSPSITECPKRSTDRFFCTNKFAQTQQHHAISDTSVTQILLTLQNHCYDMFFNYVV